MHTWADRPSYPFGGADPREEARERFSADFAAAAYETAAQLCASQEVDAAL